MAKTRVLTRLQSARAIVESYDDLSPSDIRRLPVAERELYNAALEYIETDIASTRRTRKQPSKVSHKPKSVQTRKVKSRAPKPSKVSGKSTEKTPRLPSKLKEYLSDLRTPVRKSATYLLTQYPELDHMDELEELLDDEQAEAAEETNNSAEMWFAKSHGSYGGIAKEKQRMEEERIAKWEKEQKAKRRKRQKKQASLTRSKRGSTKKRNASRKKR